MHSQLGNLDLVFHRRSAHRLWRNDPRLWHLRAHRPGNGQCGSGQPARAGLVGRVLLALGLFYGVRFRPSRNG
jgi:predicted metal-dependent hydrolase